MSISILIIEDDHDLRETTIDFLKDEGFTTLEAENGAQGIQLAIQHTPDVIVCDINMPGLSGYEVYNMLHQMNSTAVIPFIFLSAKSTRDEILTGLHLGVDDYITKPFDLHDLLDVINRRISRRKVLVEQQDEKFKVLFENTHSAACILNGSVFEYVNKPITKLLGYCTDELLGISITNIMVGESLPLYNAAVEKCKDGLRRSFSVRIGMIHKDKTVRDIEVVASQIQFKGHPCFICTLADISDMPAEEPQSKLSKDVSISDREQDVLNLICQGLTNQEIAAKLFLSERTVEGHRSRLFSKTGTKNAVALAIWAVKNSYYKI